MPKTKDLPRLLLEAILRGVPGELGSAVPLALDEFQRAFELATHWFSSEFDRDDLPKLPEVFQLAFLLRARDAEDISLCLWLAQDASSKVVRKEARRAIHYLRSQGLELPTAQPDDEDDLSEEELGTRALPGSPKERELLARVRENVRANGGLMPPYSARTKFYLSHQALEPIPSNLPPPKPSSPQPDFVLKDYFQRKALFEAQRKVFEAACSQARADLVEALTFHAQADAVCKAVEAGTVPAWWVELLEKSTFEQYEQALIRQAVPRYNSEGTIALAVQPLFYQLLKPKTQELASNFWIAAEWPDQRFKVQLSADKRPEEISLADIEGQVPQQVPTPAEIAGTALFRLRWKTEPSFEGLECIDRYGASDRQVVELARKAAGEGKAALELLEEWTKVPVEAILELVSFETQKAKDKDPVRNHGRWWRPALAAIQERQAGLRRCS